MQTYNIKVLRCSDNIKKSVYFETFLAVQKINWGYKRALWKKCTYEITAVTA